MKVIEAVVFDLLYTLVHPGSYPGGADRIDWLAEILGVDRDALVARWAAFEPELEAGRASAGRGGLGPELTWVNRVAAELGGTVSDSDLARIDAEWDFARRAVLLDPPPSTLETLRALRAHGILLGILSNTDALELRAWDRSPLAPLFDVVGLSHEIGACKPAPAAYQHVLEALGVSASRTAYVGDGSSDELAGARGVGFRFVVLAERAARRSAPSDLPRLREQADASVRTLHDLVPLVVA